MQLIDGLDFDDQSRVDENVDAKDGIEPQAIEFDVDRKLARYRIAHPFELCCQHRFVH
jgi:hypothetical protein